MSTIQQPLANNSDPMPPVRDSRPAEPETKAEKLDSTPLFWRMFGASCMAIAASLFIVLYFQMTQTINALRADVTVLREGYIQLVPKSEFSRGHSQITAEIQTLKAANAVEVGAWSRNVTEQKDEIKKLRAKHEAQVEDLQRENQQLRERVAVLESRLAKPKN